MSENTTSSALSPGFEGPEKVLEIDFAPGLGPARGLREITRPQWDKILTEARCTILNSLSNEKLDSYVLSESSLFVYPLKMMLKTCGTTTLLRAIGPLLEITEVSTKKRLSNFKNSGNSIKKIQIVSSVQRRNDVRIGWTLLYTIFTPSRNLNIIFLSYYSFYFFIYV